MVTVNKISRVGGTARIISFPLGKPPKGTCDFATQECLVECGDRMPNFEPEHEAYRLVCELSCTEIVSILEIEVMSAQNKVLAWFPESGDCPAALTDKVFEIMKGLSIPQNGFTRNKRLWELSHSILNVKMVLTEEDETKVRKYRKKGLVGLPDYYERRVKIFNFETIWMCGGGSIICGCGSVESEDFISEEDCGVCFKLKRGCHG